MEFLTKRKIQYIGNLKFALIEKENNKTKLKDLQEKLNGNIIIMLASAHNGEEKILLEFIKKYLSECKKLKIIIAPRHPERSESIIKMFKNKNIKSVIFEDSLSFKEF